MKPDDVSTAITNALVQGGAQWLMSTIAAFLPALWVMTLMLHLGRPYVLRTLRRCGLRLGADVWWMSYLLMRDGLLLVTFALSWIFFAPNEVQSAALPMTGPVAALCLLLVLAVKLSRRVDDDVTAFRWTTGFLVLGATLYFGAQVFAIEATSQSALAGFGRTFTTSSHPTAAMWVMWVSLAGIVLIAAWLAMRVVQHAERTLTQRPAGPAIRRPRTPAAAPMRGDD